jgi:hypothetical protein
MKDPDLELVSNASERVDSEWQENWSFIGKSNKVSTLHMKNIWKYIWKTVVVFVTNFLAISDFRWLTDLPNQNSKPK